MYSIKNPLDEIRASEEMCWDFSLTLSHGIVDAEAAQDLINVAGVEESVPSHHHLEGL